MNALLSYAFMPSESQDDSASLPLTRSLACSPLMTSSLDTDQTSLSILVSGHLPDPMQLLQEAKGRRRVPAPFINCSTLPFTSF